MKSRRFVTLDVFTNTRFAGNPLAVVLDAEGLESEGMQTIAREFNLSETVFVLPPEDQANLARLRIFMPYRELPFAGHPTVGAAVLLAVLNGASIGQDLNFMVEEKVGIVPCTVQLKAPDLGRARFELPRLPQRVDGTPSAVAIAAALGLEEAEIGLLAHEPSIFSAGNPFAFVPVRDLAAIQRIEVNPLLWKQAFPAGADFSAFVYTRETVGADGSFHARMLEPGLGEDPATGSAVAAFAGVLMVFEPPPNGQKTYVVEQGYEMGRPSRIVLGLDVWDGALSGATIGGEAVIVSEGTITA